MCRLLEDPCGIGHGRNASWPHGKQFPQPRFQARCASVAALFHWLRGRQNGRMTQEASSSPAPSSPIVKPRSVVYTVRVEFGDCDPARIVWYPNFFRWIDAASRHFFVECGVPPWHETEKTMGIIGTPLVDTHAKFIKTASYGDVLQIHT